MNYIFIFILLTLFILVYFKIADKYNIVDKPNERSSHSTITLRGGGIIFWLSSFLYFIFHVEEIYLFFCAITFISIVSFVDDISGLSSKLRAFFQAISLSIIFSSLGVFDYQPWWLIILLYILCVGIVNAYNFMDGINGMTGIYSLVVLLSILYVNNNIYTIVDNDFIIFPVLACLIFLCFNYRKKAKCFAGDVGSISMAFIITYLLINLILISDSFIWILFLAVYGVDSVTTIAHRLYLGENIFEAHRMHLYQVLSNEYKIDHRYVSLLYGCLQTVISLVVIYWQGKVDNIYVYLVVLVPLILIYLIKFTLLKKYYNTLNSPKGSNLNFNHSTLTIYFMKQNIFDKIFRSLLENRYLSRWFVLTIDLSTIAIMSLCSYMLLTIQTYKSSYLLENQEFGTCISVSCIISLFAFLFFRTYQGIIRYSTIHELQRIFVACLFTSFVSFLCLFKVFNVSLNDSMVYSCALFLFSMLGLNGFRILVSQVYRILVTSFGTNRPIPVFIWAVDEQDLSLAQMMNSSQSRFNIKGLIIQKENSKLISLSNLPVLEIDEPDDLESYRIGSILFTDKKLVREVTPFVEAMLDISINIYVAQLKHIEHIKTLQDSIMNENIQPLQIEDLLDRPEINISMDEIALNVAGKTILVTGAAGSIGSEIVRQLAHFEAKRIICFDQAETPLHYLELEFQKKYPNIEFVFIIGDVRYKDKIARVFETYHPHIVYHAAAYKHVPIMEKAPCEAINTNVKGSKIVVDLSIQHNVETFVMVSTDKAVNPTNVMGCSKRIAEIYVQSNALHAARNNQRTKVITTRFGNVLGSNGSVINLFKKQIEQGGPVTVTDPEITRYFMTIPEACRLVLEASVIGESGHIYVFDMGKPVKILELAKRMIELSGLRPNKDIKIEFSGLRPGEKLYEELLNDSEITIPTSHQKILIAKVREYELNKVLDDVNQLIVYAEKEDKYNTVLTMKRIVPEFISKNSEYEALDQKEEQVYYINFKLPASLKRRVAECNCNRYMPANTTFSYLSLDSK